MGEYRIQFDFLKRRHRGGILRTSPCASSIEESIALSKSNEWFNTYSRAESWNDVVDG